jgi:hypothetical protein
MHLVNVFYFIIGLIFTYTNTNNNIVLSFGRDFMDTTVHCASRDHVGLLGRHHVGLSYVQLSPLRWTFTQLFFWRTWIWQWTVICTFVQLWTCVQVLPMLWTPSQCIGIYGWHLMMCFKHSLMTFILLTFGLFESIVGSYLQLWTFIVLCLFWPTCAHPLSTCCKHSVTVCCSYGLVCYYRPHPSSILLGSGYTSDDTGDGPPPPLMSWPTRPRSGSAPVWNPIYIDFRRFEGFTIRNLLFTFRQDSIRYFFPQLDKHLPIWENILYQCNRHDLVAALHRYYDRNMFTLQDLRLLVYTSMDDILHSWGGSIPLTGPYSKYHHYFRFLESLGPFGDECWITVHASLFWWFHLTTNFVLCSDSYFLKRWTRMSKSRQHLVLSMRKIIPPYVRVQNFKDLYATVRRSLLHSTSLPELKFTPNHPSWRAPPPPPSWMKLLRNRLRSMQTFIVPIVLLVPIILSRSPSPTPQLLFPPPHRHRNKKRKKKRRMDFYRKYFRAPPPPRIHQPPLACILAPDIHLNRSSGSFNARDPPD